MLTYSLNGQWSMGIVGRKEQYEATVPGSVYSDLLANGAMEDPYYRDNELPALALMENDFTYEREFTLDEDMLSEEEILLHFEGLDTLADVYLNGEWVAAADNMHRVWDFPVKKYIKGENIIRIVFHSPTKFIREKQAEDPIPGTGDAMYGFPYLRKAHCMFGWDWGPRLPDAGIWRNVSVIGYHNARIDGVYVRQKHQDGQVKLSFDIAVDALHEEQIRHIGGEYCLNVYAVVTVTTPNGEHLVVSREAVSNGITVSNPQLWWPNGFGEQPLYTVTVDLYDNDSDEKLDSWSKRIGLRTMTISREKDEWGESFCHEVNGVKIFAMGADYIPEDNVLPRMNRERTRHLLEQAKLANYNCVRVWGGGFYPDEYFYDACDELGLMVWQDFMFACSVYNLTEEFEASITAEFIDNIKRIRNHASLGLWCGNNEMEMFVLQGYGWVNKPSQKSDYIKMYEYILPKVLKEYDPDTFYWPASPSSGGGFDDPNAENRGDVHYWDVWHGSRPITEYRKFYFRYVSEFGFQSFPGLKTCESFTLPEDRNVFSYVMEKHQRNAAANGKIMNYMEQTFLYPTKFETVLYASQLMQAEAIRYGVEHFRRNRGRCMGAVVWQLNDCWPVASWSSIDYYGRWKALHYCEKRFFAPLMISCAEEGILTQDTNPNAQPYEVIKSITLNVANETREDRAVTVRWELRNEYAEVIRSGCYQDTVPALSSKWFVREDMSDADLYHNYVSYSCETEGEVVSSGTVLFTAPKQFHFPNPNLRARVEGTEIVVQADAYARGVEILNEDETMLLSDNYFDMNSGEKRVTILSGNPIGLKLRSVYDIR